MIQYLIDQDGRYIGIIEGSGDEIAAQIPSGCQATILPPPRTTDYWNGTNWVGIGPQPAWYFNFDYSAKRWVDTRDLAQTKKEKWEQIKLERNKFEFGGFTYNGVKYDSDYISQGRILAAVVFGKPVTWTASNNVLVDLDVEALQGLGAAMAAHVNEAHHRSRQARELIELAETVNEVDDVLF